MLQVDHGRTVRQEETQILISRTFYSLSCQDGNKTTPVDVYDVAVVNIPLFHRLISFSCADAQRQNVDLGDNPAKRGE